MKKFLALIAITLFVFVGCTPEDISLGDNEDITKIDTTAPDMVVEGNTTVAEFPEGVEFVDNEDRKKAADEKIEKALEADAQIAEDKKKLDEISATRPLQVSDCELVINPGFKESCLVFAAVNNDVEEE